MSSQRGSEEVVLKVTGNMLVWPPSCTVANLTNEQHHVFFLFRIFFFSKTGDSNFLNPLSQMLFKFSLLLNMAIVIPQSLNIALTRARRDHKLS